MRKFGLGALACLFCGPILGAPFEPPELCFDAAELSIKRDWPSGFRTNDGFILRQRDPLVMPIFKVFTDKFDPNLPKEVSVLTPGAEVFFVDTPRPFKEAKLTVRFDGNDPIGVVLADRPADPQKTRYTSLVAPPAGPGFRVLKLKHSRATRLIFVQFSNLEDGFKSLCIR